MTRLQRTDDNGMIWYEGSLDLEPIGDKALRLLANMRTILRSSAEIAMIELDGQRLGIIRIPAAFDEETADPPTDEDGDEIELTKGAPL